MNKKSVLIIALIVAMVLLVYSCSYINAINGANDRAEAIVEDYFTNKLAFDGWYYEVLYNHGGFGNGYFSNGIYTVSGNFYLDNSSPYTFTATVKFDDEWDEGRLISMEVYGLDILNY